MKKRTELEVNSEIGTIELLEMEQLQPLQKQVFVEKHLISPQLIDEQDMELVYYQKMKKLAL